MTPHHTLTNEELAEIQRAIAGGETVSRPWVPRLIAALRASQAEVEAVKEGYRNTLLARHVPELVAEVERLRAEVERLRTEKGVVTCRHCGLPIVHESDWWMHRSRTNDTPACEPAKWIPGQMYDGPYAAPRPTI